MVKIDWGAVQAGDIDCGEVHWEVEEDWPVADQVVGDDSDECDDALLDDQDEPDDELDWEFVSSNGCQEEYDIFTKTVNSVSNFFSLIMGTFLVQQLF